MLPKIAVLSTNKIESHELISLFNKEGYEAVFYSDAKKQTLNNIINTSPDIVLIDLDLETTDGIEVCYFLRNEKKTNSFLLLFSDKTEEYIEIEAFKAGADDYIIKPINPRLFVRKIKAILNRSNQEKEKIKQKQLVFKDVTVDLDSYTVFKEDKETYLPRKDFEILQLFILNPKKVYSREEIYKLVWSSEESFNPRIIDVHIRKIREKVGNYFIETIKGVGYKLSV
ncbi:MAG: response regulator transcription factor [Flavobacteriales bacterium]|nr:response regulator transcription factor [Flavobacteriales bacterium]MCB9364344.1 response regulator transcription factor [Flavobacteriales bacterium]